MTRPPFTGAKTTMDSETKKIKNRLERQLKVVLARKKKQELKAYPLLCQIYKLKGRCYPCEKRGMKPGECSGVSAECLRALGVK